MGCLKWGYTVLPQTKQNRQWKWFPVLCCKHRSGKIPHVCLFLESEGMQPKTRRLYSHKPEKHIVKLLISVIDSNLASLNYLFTFNCKISSRKTSCYYFIFCFVSMKRQKCCSQEFVCVEIFLSFFFRLCPRLVCFSQRTFGSHHSVFCESGGEIASLSRVKHSSWLIESKRLMQASTLCSCQAANHSFFPCSLS